MPARFNPPPNWPAPPEGWTPQPGWQPDPAWGPPPPGWTLYVDDQPRPPKPEDDLSGLTALRAYVGGWSPRRKVIVGAVVALLVLGGIGNLAGVGDDDLVATAQAEEDNNGMGQPGERQPMTDAECRDAIDQRGVRAASAPECAAARGEYEAEKAAEEAADQAASDAEAAAKAEADRLAAEQAAAAAAAEAEAAAAEEAARTDPASYAEIADRDYALIARDPDAHIGGRYVVYGHVVQADSATGNFSFRANTSGSEQSEWYDYEVNTVVVAHNLDPAVTSGVVQDDLVKMWVEVDGSITYDTTLGGATTVPQLTVHMVEVVGTST